MSATPVERARAAYAQKIRGLAELRSESLAGALASVPREDFLGPGPWKLMLPMQVGLSYTDSPDADPCHLYESWRSIRSGGSTTASPRGLSAPSSALAGRGLWRAGS